jgi:hypothetical protein
MPAFCLDTDILALEPIVYLSDGFQLAQPLIQSTDGVLSGTSFSSASADFLDAQVAAGMVLVTWSTLPAEGAAWDIRDVTGATTLGVSVLQADRTATPVAPPAGTGLHYAVRTFAPAISAVSDALAEKFRRTSESAPITTADFADSRQLALTTACGTLAQLFTARATNARPHDANWIKAEFYRCEFRRLQDQLRLAIDLDGDGLAESTRTLGNVSLRRV